MWKCCYNLPDIVYVKRCMDAIKHARTRHCKGQFFKIRKNLIYYPFLDLVG